MLFNIFPSPKMVVTLVNFIKTWIDTCALPTCVNQSREVHVHALHEEASTERCAWGFLPTWWHPCLQPSWWQCAYPSWAVTHGGVRGEVKPVLSHPPKSVLLTKQFSLWFGAWVTKEGLAATVRGTGRPPLEAQIARLWIPILLPLLNFQILLVPQFPQHRTEMLTTWHGAWHIVAIELKCVMDRRSQGRWAKTKQRCGNLFP